MRKMEITEVDSNCYIVTTSDFKEPINYHWDKTTRKFYAEWQFATMEKRRFQQEHFDFAEFPTIGHAINHIIKRERDQCDAQYRSLVSALATA